MRTPFSPFARVRVAVIPAAGNGTRLLPATRAMAKELLPVGGRPAIDWIIDEARGAGIEQLVVVSSNRKPEIERYIASSDGFLHGGTAQPADAQSDYVTREGLEITFAFQENPKGLGDAIRVGCELVPDEEVAVLLPDELFFGGPNLLCSMLDVHTETRKTVVSLMKVSCEAISAYGCAQITSDSTDRIMNVSACVEKPDPSDAPSDFAIAGRYVLDDCVIKQLEWVPPTYNGEIQLTTALDYVARSTGLVGLQVTDENERIDIGNWQGWLHANNYAFEKEQIRAKQLIAR